MSAAPPTLRPRGSVPAAAALLAAAASGCGYSYGLDTGIAPRARTVAVEVVRNESFRQLLERPLNAELYEALALHSGLVPAGFGEADVVLQASLRRIDGEAIVRGITPVREGGLIYTVEVRLVDGRTGEVLRRARFRDRAEFRVPVGEDETSANLEAARDIARRIVLALDDDF